MDFEEEFAQLGCQVHAFDPTIAAPDLGNQDMMHFHPIGLAHFNGMQTIGKKVSLIPPSFGNIFEIKVPPCGPCHGIHESLGRGASITNETRLA